MICELVAKLPCVKNHCLKKPLLRSVKSVDKLDLIKSSEANHKTELRTILEENGRQINLKGQRKSRRHSDVVERNGALVTRLSGNYYSAKVMKPLHLKGQMKYLKRYDMVLFVCSPM